jgi:ribosomal protein S18 acetylase RimI-like enzyme
MSTLAVRPALPQDEIFLYDLYIAVRGPLFAQAPMSAAQRDELLRMQCRAQMASYAHQFPNSCYHLILLDGNPVGRLWVAPGEQEWVLVDIAIHPSRQSKGLGAAVVQQVQREAEKVKRPIRSTVDRFNTGSLRFHQRLGFQIVREDMIQYYMEWQPLLIG